jgi:hypothetical protein
VAVTVAETKANERRQMRQWLPQRAAVTIEKATSTLLWKEKLAATTNLNSQKNSSNPARPQLAGSLLFTD